LRERHFDHLAINACRRQGKEGPDDDTKSWLSQLTSTALCNDFSEFVAAKFLFEGLQFFKMLTARPLRTPAKTRAEFASHDS
jgi:hypothetical protein